MRLILDTNILFSPLLSPLGSPAKLLDAWERKTFTLVACDALIAELRDVAGRPFFRARLRASAAELLAAGLRDFSFFCRDLPSDPVAPDAKDSYLLALAEASPVKFLVTGDKELLVLKQHKSSRMIAPAAMIGDPKKKLRAAERQILAGLEHENVARLLDGGTTDEGHPYFVIELVGGKPIDDHCDEGKLRTAARLDFSINRRRGSTKLYQLDTDRALLLDTNLLTSVFSVVLADALDRALTSKRGLVPALTASAEFG